MLSGCLLRRCTAIGRWQKPGCTRSWGRQGCGVTCCRNVTLRAVGMAAPEIGLQRRSLLPPLRRTEYLDAACDGDADLRREAERLLASHDADSTFLESPAAVDYSETSVNLVGRKIGPYQVQTVAGAGGMGEVYQREGQPAQSHRRDQDLVRRIRRRCGSPRALRARSESDFRA